MDFCDLRVYSPGYQAIEWGFDYSQLVDQHTALAQPTSIAVLPVYFDNPNDFAYKPEFQSVRLQEFDLVLFTEIEWRPHSELLNWIQTTGVQQWLLHVASIHYQQPWHANMIYRPAWSFNFLRWNEHRDVFALQRPYAFDCLIGARRTHRDFIMLSLVQSGLLNQGLVTYRDIFNGHSIEQTPLSVAKLFPGIELPWPYVSENLDPAWETKENLDNSISGLVPWQIYDHAWFTILCETIGEDRIFLSAEKVGKCMLGRRLFVHFGVQGFLAQLRELGFETFGSVIDESYDNIVDALSRWTAAFDQVRWLCQQDLGTLVPHLLPILDHNRHRLFELEREKREEMKTRIMAYLK